MTNNKKHENSLYAQAMKSSRFADWIYHDVRLDGDGEANVRSVTRFRLIDEQFGRECLLGMCLWWGVSAYRRLEDAHIVKNIPDPPELLPKNIDEVMADESLPIEKRRAYVSARQFVSTLTHDNIQMAEAIFNAAYDTDWEDCATLMLAILWLSIRISNVAIRIKSE